ncbi:MAG: hypothetical protein ACRC33_30430 [Gemmataceae bacterium]
MTGGARGWPAAAEGTPRRDHPSSPAVDADDEHGWRPVFHAGLWRHLPAVRLPLDAGADRDARSGRGGGTTLAEWLAQYPDDGRDARVNEALRSHGAGA